MTEKRFKVDYDITVGNYCLHDECKAKGVDGYIAYLSDEERANNLCDLLNKQDERIQELESQLEFWKGDACSVSNENSILHNELDIAMSQGYTLTDAFREYIESKREVSTDD